MHEARLVRDLVDKVIEVAANEDAAQVHTIRIEIGADSHLTPKTFRDQFAVMAAGSVAASAAIDVVDPDLIGQGSTSVESATGVRLVSITVGD